MAIKLSLQVKSYHAVKLLEGLWMLRERPTVLRYTYIAHLVLNNKLVRRLSHCTNRVESIFVKQ